MAGRPRRGQPGEGRTSNKSINMGGLGSAFGGGGDNPAYGQDPGNVEVNPDIAQYGTDNPFKPLNWFGHATGQADPYSQFRMQQAVSEINLKHDMQMEAIRNSNMTAQEKARAADQVKLQRQAQIGAVIPGATDQQIEAFSTGINPYSKDIGSASGRKSLNASLLAGTEADIANRRLMDPLGEEERMQRLSAEDAAQGIGNQSVSAQTWDRLHPRLSPGETMFDSSMMTPGTSAVNLSLTPQERSMALAQGLPLPPQGLQFRDAQGDPIGIRLKGGLAGQTAPLYSPSFNASVMASPQQLRPEFGGTAYPQPTPAMGPASMYAPLSSALSDFINRTLPYAPPSAPTMQPSLTDEEIQRRRLLQQAIKF